MLVRLRLSAMAPEGRFSPPRCMQEKEVMNDQVWIEDVIKFLEVFLVNSPTNERVAKLLREGESILQDRKEKKR